MSETARQTGFIDHFGLWASLGASLYLMPFGALLVPALSIEQAALAAVVAAFLASLLVAVIARVAAKNRASTLDLLSEPFGQRGRLPVAAVLLVRHVTLTAFALVIIGDSAALIGERALGADLRPLWVVLFAAIALPLTTARVDRRGVRIAAAALVGLLALAITASAYMEFEIPSYLRRPAVGGWPSFAQAVDLMLIFPLLWLPVVADFARDARTPAAAARGSFAGLFLTASWFGALGTVYLPATASGDIPGFLVGMELGLVSLAILFVLQADELAVNARASHTVAEVTQGTLARFTPAFTLCVAAAGAMFLHIGDLEGYALLAGSVFVPAFGMALAYSARPSRFTVAVPILAWLGGALVYQSIAPAEIGWWQDTLDWATGGLAGPYPPADDASWLGATIPSFIFAFGVQALGSVLAGVGARLDTAPTPG